MKKKEKLQEMKKKREIKLGLNGAMHPLKKEYNKTLAKNDGFENEEDFWQWFNEPFSGVIIHWTNFVYS